MQSEAAIQQQIVKMLEAYARHDIEWHHVPNGEKRSIKTAKRLKTLGVKAGVADIMLLIDGRAYGIELKTETGRQSREQSEWQEQFERAGGIYRVARGLDEAVAALQDIGAFRSGISFTTASSGSGVRTRQGASASCRTYTKDIEE